MRAAEGIINVVQEGRFRLVADDGRSALFQLSAEAPLEPQDLETLVARRRRVQVLYSPMAGRGAGLAHDIVEPDGKGPLRLPDYFRNEQ